MNPVLLGLGLLSIFTAFIASLLSGLINFLVFNKYKDTYIRIFLYSIVGEVLGLVTLFAVLYIYQIAPNLVIDPEHLVFLPFYLMLVGLLVGSIIVFIKRHKFE